jgi:hypothetical protein
MQNDITIEELVKRLKKASKVLLAENKNYRADAGLQKLMEAMQIINK